jgi:hypothetical protein
MSILEHAGFGVLRKDGQTRDWYRRSDILDALRAMGCRWTWYEISFAFAGIPKPEKRYGHYRYTREHMDAAVAAWRNAHGG